MLLGMNTRYKFCVINDLGTTWNGDDCCLNIVIGPKVVDINLKYGGNILAF